MHLVLKFPFDAAPAVPWTGQFKPLFCERSKRSERPERLRAVVRAKRAVRSASGVREASIVGASEACVGACSDRQCARIDSVLE